MCVWSESEQTVIDDQCMCCDSNQDRIYCSHLAIKDHRGICLIANGLCVHVKGFSVEYDVRLSVYNSKLSICQIFNSLDYGENDISSTEIFKKC